ETECLLDVGQLGLQDQAQPGHEVVGLAELRDAPALPGLPRVLRSVRHRVGVALDDRDLVAVTREQEGGPQAADAAADDEYVCHVPAGRRQPGSRRATASSTRVTANSTAWSRSRRALPSAQSLNAPRIDRSTNCARGSAGMSVRT